MVAVCTCEDVSLLLRDYMAPYLRKLSSSNFNGFTASYLLVGVPY
jgi:hypothetical protein